jgi:type IV secretory pathway TraG/TraD family ATPase VirD4
MANSQQQPQQTQQAPSESSILGDGLKLFAQPDILPFGIILLAIAILYLGLTIIGRNSRKHGHLATAREANSSEKKAGINKLLEKIENPSLTNGVFYICEPIGTDIPNPQDLEDYKGGRITPIIDINTSTLVVGVPGCGKTANVINPAIKSAIKSGYRIFMFDAKYPEQAEQIAPYAIDHGYDISVYAPGYEESATFNILDAVEDENDSTTADQVVMTLRKNLGGDDKTNSFFETGGQGMVAGAILLAKRAARLSGRPEVANLLLVDEIISMHDLTARLIANRDEISRAAYRSFTQFLSAHADVTANDTAASLRSTAASIMKPLVSSRFIDSIAGLPDFPCFHEDKPFWIGESNLVIFGLNQDLRGVVSPLIATAIEQIGNYNLNSTRQSDTPLAIFLDEIPQINVPDVFDLWGPVKRSLGCSIMFGMQYLGQAEETYGEHVIPKILGAGNKFFFNPGSVANAEIISAECGNKEVLIGSNSKSRSSGQQSSYSSSESDQIQSVAMFDPLFFSQLPVGACVAQLAATKTGRGVEEKVGLPYRMRFERLDDECKQQEAESKERWAEMVEVAIANKKRRNPEGSIDYKAKSNEYRSLAEDYLPLSSNQSVLGVLDQAIAGAVKEINKKPSQFVSLKSLVLMAEHYKWKLEGDFADRNVLIPDEWGEITLENLEATLQKADIKTLSKGGRS